MIALSVAILVLVQDSPDLRWKADAERSFTCAWKMSQKAGKPEEPATTVEMAQEHTAKATREGKTLFTSEATMEFQMTPEKK